MRILGIDPGLTVTGYGLVTAGARGKYVLEEAGVIRTSPRQEISIRLKKIYDGVREIIRIGTPGVLIVEKLYSHYQHPATAILMGHARAAVYLAAAEAGIPILDYSATRVKKAVSGSGHASKIQMQRTVGALLGLRAIPAPSDVADALALAIAYIYLRGNKE